MRAFAKVPSLRTARHGLAALARKGKPDRPRADSMGAAMSAPKKVVLAYSGGLDTSIILKWLQTEYGCEVVTFTADLGQGEELEPARAEGAAAGDQAREHPHRRCARGIRARLRVPDVPGECAL
jgi:tRNA(Ile)-lysidine synthase TilS/MesJ